MSVLRATLLGGIACRTTDHTAIEFPTRKVRALFAFLAVTAGQEQGREKVAALLWADSGEQAARASLRSALSRLRHALPQTAQTLLEARGDSILFGSKGLDVDVLSFRQHAAERTPDALEQVVELYSGAFLEGFASGSADFDEWIAAERRQLEEILQRSLQRLLDHYVTTGAIDLGIQVALRLIRIDPLHEPVHRSLIRLYLHQRRVGAALDQYRRCRELLARELGVAPDAETERLRAELGKEFPAIADSVPEVETDNVPERASLARTAASFRQRLPGDPAGRPRIVVFSFSQPSPPAGGEHLADGLAEDIATELGRFSELEIVAPTSAFAYRSARVSTITAAVELRADFALCGSVRVQQRSLRISVQLVEVRTDRQVWAERYEAELAEFFAVQDDIVCCIVGELVGRIETERLREAQRKRPDQWAAYDLWLRGWHVLRQPQLSAILDARQLFEQAIDLDPQFARPHIGLALAHLNEWTCYSWNFWAFPRDEVLELARTAVRLDDKDNRAHCMIGATSIYMRDYDAAERHFGKALALNPNDADVLAHASWAMALIGEHETAVDLGRKALRLAPFFPEWYVGTVSVASFAARRYDEVIETIATAPEADCRMPAFAAAAYAHAGQPEKGARYRDTLYRHYRGLVDDPDDGSCVAWLLTLDPFKHAADTEHHEQGLRKAGFE